MEQVSHVHSDPTLQRFWRSGSRVENPTVVREYPTGVFNTHPAIARLYSSSYGGGYDYFTAAEGKLKNYHLTTNLDTAIPFGPLQWCPIADPAVLAVNRPAWTLAYLLGTAPNREWLIYAHSTGISGATLTNVAVTIPDFDTVTLPEVPVEGAFYHLQESDVGQIARPDSDISSTGWIAVPTGSYYTTLDEAFAAIDDADYCYTNTPSAVMQVRLQDVTDPATGYGHYLRYRVAGTTTVQLMESETVTIATRSQVDAGLTTHVEALTPAEADAITDYGALSVKITAA